MKAGKPPKSGGAPCANSFSADTLVMTQVGLRPIAELEVGDIVLAYNEVSGRIEAHPITDTISHIDPEIVLLTIDGELLETTADHPFYVMDSAPWLAEGQTTGRWVDAGELSSGDDVWRADGSTGEVKSVEVVAVQQRMYNLTVDVAHTFFVGQQGWLVHNCNWSIGSRRVSDVVGDFPVLPSQAHVDKSYVERVVPEMLDGKFDWNRMKNPIEIVNLPDGSLVIKEGHHRWNNLIGIIEMIP